MSRKRYGIFLIGLLAALLCWLAAFWEAWENTEGGRAFTFYYDRPVLTGKEMEAFIQEQEKEDLPAAAAWKERDRETFAGDLGTVCQGELWEVRGSMEVLFAGGLIQGNFPWQEDRQGCMLSRSLSRELFGTEEGVGNRVEVQGETYQVRGILEGEENLLALWAEEETGLENFRLSYRTDRTPVSKAEELLYQMTGTEPERILEGNLYTALSGFFLLVPVLVLGALAGLGSLGRGRGLERGQKKLLWYGLAGIFWLLVLWGLGNSLRLSPDYFPSMWSDLSFYPQLIEEKARVFRELTAGKLCPPDRRILAGTGRCFLLSGASLFLVLLSLGRFPWRESWHSASGLHRIKEKRVDKS